MWLRTYHLIVGKSQRAFSIKTRIKTPCGYSLKSYNNILREHFPLKQGLRHAYQLKLYIIGTTQRALSIKTRIKTRPLIRR